MPSYWDRGGTPTRARPLVHHDAAFVLPGEDRAQALLEGLESPESALFEGRVEASCAWWRRRGRDGAAVALEFSVGAGDPGEAASELAPSPRA